MRKLADIVDEGQAKGEIRTQEAGRPVSTRAAGTSPAHQLMILTMLTMLRPFSLHGVPPTMCGPLEVADLHGGGDVGHGDDPASHRRRSDPGFQGRRGRPEFATQTGPHVEIPPTVTDTPTIAGGTGGDVCPRCGVPFAETDEDVLRRCSQLAQRGAA